MNTTSPELTLSAVGNFQPERWGKPDHAACEAHELPVSRRQTGDFWSKVLVTECCWLWTRARFQGTGYGAFWLAGRLVKAHRFAYMNMVGPIPDGLDLLHSCDVRHCVRPDHLRPGTATENARDMVAKGRNGRQDGEHNHNARFTWATIREIRSRRRAGESMRQLALRFQTDPHYIGTIVRQEVWREPEPVR